MDITSSRHRQIDTLDVSVCGEVRDNEEQSTSDRPKELWFDPWLAAKGDVLREAVQNTLSFFATMERRQRARKAQDQRALERCVEAVIVNIAYGALFPTEAGRSVVVGLATGKKPTRYDHQGIPAKTLRKVIKRLNDSPVLDLSVGAWTLRRTSTIAATEWFVRLITEEGVSEAVRQTQGAGANRPHQD